MSVVLGAIADDFTGATDLANTWVKEGVRVTQVIGVPDEQTEIGDAEAIVVALKSRTSPTGQAVEQSLSSLSWLRSKGARQIVFKYCSTFDSTPAGNIGPVADALADAVGSNFALICPAFPANGRTIYQGHLFVGDKLLSDSSMKDHPLTPMRDSSLIRLMEAQSSHRVGLIPLDVVRLGPAGIRDCIATLKAGGMRYGVVDTVTDEDLRSIGQAAAGHSLATGGSGIGLGLPANFRARGLLLHKSRASMPINAGRELVLAGSCSVATRAQIEHVKGLWPVRKLDPDRLAAEADEIDRAIAWAGRQPAGTPVLIYASADPEEIARNQNRYGADRAGQMIEAAFASMALALRDDGFLRIVVAGGETSGAVVSALGIRALRIGPEIAPGVPWTQSIGERPVALALKSGNFGAERFFPDAFAMWADRVGEQPD